MDEFDSDEEELDEELDWLDCGAKELLFDDELLVLLVVLELLEVLDEELELVEFELPLEEFVTIRIIPTMKIIEATASTISGIFPTRLALAGLALDCGCIGFGLLVGRGLADGCDTIGWGMGCGCDIGCG